MRQVQCRRNRRYRRPETLWIFQRRPHDDDGNLIKNRLGPKREDTGHRVIGGGFGPAGSKRGQHMAVVCHPREPRHPRHANKSRSADFWRRYGIHGRPRSRRDVSVLYRLDSNSNTNICKAFVWRAQQKQQPSQQKAASLALCAFPKIWYQKFQLNGSYAATAYVKYARIE